MMTPVIPVDYGAELNAARLAYRDLMLGNKPSVFVDQNGERIEYAKADMGKLASYIAGLERLCGVALPTAGPMRVLF